MAVTIHQSIKSVIQNASFPQWQVANKLGISERTLIVWLRDEASLDTDRKNRVLTAIKELSNGK
ncbi:MAG: hypothetical protein ABF755_07080 [Oenococcus oeni]|uniref:hypothetical protein n=1 Tax=Oenococcus oeni TaxID=1247 RepID=UPI0008F877C6|nr:hypothetical protein [Oenococcus oeni]OIM22377.1 hypothetical protein ATX60_09835 [Oenococcus oeni]SYW00342.1 conserved hypothetical protein [Oenococcus oeni]